MNTPKQLALFDNPSDDRPLPEIIAAEFNFTITYHDCDDGIRRYAVYDWLRGVAETKSASDTNNFWRSMQRRIEVLRTVGTKLPYINEKGKTYKADYTDDKGLYLIAQLRQYKIELAQCTERVEIKY